MTIFGHMLFHELLTLALALPVAVYSLWILIYFRGWQKLKEFSPGFSTPSTPVSIVVAVRNEQHTIPMLLQDLLGQDFQPDFEIIIVDDASQDNTAGAIQPFLAKNKNVRLIHLPEDRDVKAHKKKALSKGIEAATYDIIVTTDADCRMGKKWLSTLVTFYEKKKYKLIIGPVAFHEEKNIFEKFQALEFASLVGITGASAAFRNPVLCNGANLAFEKSAFFDDDGYNSFSGYASGDDTGLLHKIKKKYGGKAIGFLKSAEAVVYTKAQPTPARFFNQRRRWASKTRHYNDFTTLALAIVAGLCSVSVVLSLLLSFFSSKFALVFIILFSIKTAVDLIFLIPVTAFFKKQRLLWLMVPMQVLYVFYVVFAGALSQSGKYEWKGRRVN